MLRSRCLDEEFLDFRNCIPLHEFSCVLVVAFDSDSFARELKEMNVNENTIYGTMYIG